MNTLHKNVRTVVLGFAYGLLLLFALIASYRLDGVFPDGIIWIPVTVVVLTFIFAFESRLRPLLGGIAVIPPIIAPFVGGGPDMFILVTVFLFVLSCAIGLGFSLVFEGLTRILSSRPRAEQDESLKP